MAKKAKNAAQEFEEFFKAQGDSLFVTIADRVDEALAMEGMTAYIFAQSCGIVSDSYRSMWWSSIKRRAAEGRWNPQLKTILRIAFALGLSLQELCEPFK